jgi:putative SOS response-associated peptidase YedK
MCNLYRMEKAPDAIVALVRELGREVAFPEGVPNFEPREVRITDRAPILREREGAVELVERRWSWPGPGGKPVFNFRGEGRRFAPAERCVVLTDGFYEFTAPPETPGAPKAKRKDRWLFEWPGHDWFGIAGLVRADPKVGEAFTLLTCPPGADVAPYHNRQVVLLSPRDCLNWLDPASDPEAFIRPLPEGSLAVTRA